MQSEQQRRDLARRHAGEVVAGSGRIVPPRRLGQMVSLRLEPDLAAALRTHADRQDTSLSGVMREAAVRLVDGAHAPAAAWSWRIVRVPGLPPAPTVASNNGVTVAG